MLTNVDQSRQRSFATHAESKDFNSRMAAVSGTGHLESRIFFHGHTTRGQPPILSCGDMHIPIDEMRLRRIAAEISCMNVKAVSPGFDLDRARELPSSVGNIPFGAILENYATLILYLSDQPQLRSALELDDAIYKVIAVLLNAELVEPDSYFHDGGRLDVVCAYIHMHLNEPLQLADLEKNSGMSRRNLQYVFMREFSCSPMQWVRTERLTVAHRKLVNGTPGTRVTAIALSCGFDNLAMFSTYFKQRFGESPKQILKRSMEERSVGLAPPEPSRIS